MPQFQKTSEEALAEAKRAMSLAQLIQQLTGATAKKRMTCPICQAKDKFGIFERGGVWLYKCFNIKDACPANKPGDQVGFIALLHNLDRKAAFKSFLRLTGVAEL